MKNPLADFIKFYFFDAWINFSGTNTPSFSAIKPVLTYDHYWKSRTIPKPNRPLRLREKIVFDHVPFGSSVIDYGCGTSNILFHLQKEKKCTVLGLDISQKAVNFQKKYGVKAEVLSNQLKFKKVNYIIATEVLEHLTNPEEIVLSLKKKTDYFIFSVPNSAYFAYRFKLFFHGRISMQWMYHPSEHVRYWSHIEFIEWAQSLGLTLNQFICSEGIGSRFNLLPNLLSWNVVYIFKTQ